MDGSSRAPGPALVGRDAPLAELREAVAAAGAGDPSVILLSGETGVGKTALVRTLAEEGDLTTLSGGCVPVAGDPLPFAPLTQALRRLGDVPAVRRQLERSPDLARLLPGPPMSASADATASASTKLALFQGVLELLERLGAAGPVMLVVEDLHWADRSTLDLLRFLATNFSGERVTLLVSHRTDAVVAGSPLASWLAEMGRLPLTRRLVLERLGSAETEELVARLGGEGAELAQATFERSAGNPLFIEHLIRQGSPTPALPTTLQQLLLDRVATLEAPTRRLLRAQSVLARASRVEDLAAVLASDAPEVEEWARDAVLQHVLDVRADGTLDFAHPAFREVLYAELLGSERSRLHRRAAEVMAADPGSAAGELARHWLAAGEQGQALEASVAAGEAAEAMYAFADAQAEFVQAAGLASALGLAPRRRPLLARAAQSAYLAGDAEGAVALAEEALAAPGDHTDEPGLFERLGAYHFVGGHGPEAEDWLRRALSAVEEAGSARTGTVLRARVYAGLAMLTAAWSRTEEAEDWCARGLEAARAVGARREEGLVRNALGMVAAVRNDPKSAIEHERAALAMAHETGGADDLALAYVNLTHALGLAGRLEEVAEIAGEGSRLLTRMGLASQFGDLLTANACEALISSGRLDEARPLVAAALAHPAQGIMAAPMLLQAARLASAEGHLELAWDHCERARLVLESHGAPDSWRRLAAEIGIDIELWAGHPESAYELAVDLLHQVAGTDEEAFGGTVAALGLRALADQVERWRDPASRARLMAHAEPLEAAISRREGTGVLQDEAVLAWQHAERARLHHTATPQHWELLRERWLEAGMVLSAAYAAWREAEARLDAGVDAEAIARLREAHRTAATIGIPDLASELERLAGWHRIDLVPVPAPRTGEEDPLASYGLTDREREVLAALAAGLTNREIAEDLVISVKTASVHVSNILRKLDVAGRQEAARVAHRLGAG